MAQPTDLAAPAGEHPIVLFDGVCNLCTRSVRFIIARDPADQFRFASAQSETGKRLLRLHLGSDAPPGSLVLLDAAGVHLRSTAALRVAARLSAPWRWLRPLLLIPAPLRDLLYRLIAASRYRLFGKADACWVPTPTLARRFLP